MDTVKIGKYIAQKRKKPRTYPERYSRAAWNE